MMSDLNPLKLNPLISTQQEVREIRYAKDLWIGRISGVSRQVWTADGYRTAVLIAMIDDRSRLIRHAWCLLEPAADVENALMQAIERSQLWRATISNNGRVTNGRDIADRRTDLHGKDHALNTCPARFRAGNSTPQMRSRRRRY